jgi:glycosyltransferase involved in cell wall biosynthesis
MDVRLPKKRNESAFRLAFVTARFWPFVGDVPTHLFRLAESLIALGSEVTVVMPQWRRDWPRQMIIGEVPLIRLRGSPRGGWSTLRWMYSLSRWLREQNRNQLDGIVVAGLRHEAYVALRAARRAEIPVILMAGEDDLAWQRTVALGGRIAARCREATAVVAPSDVLAQQLTAAGCVQQAVKTVPRRVPIPLPRSPLVREISRASIAAANYDLVTTPAAPVALAVGRLIPENRFGDLVRAWRIVTARHPQARLWIVGDGPEREDLYRQIGDLDQRFRALLPGSFDCLDDLMQAADLLLVPGTHAIAPLALLEAMAAGLPVIAADAPAVSDYAVPEQTGLLYSAGDAKALAGAVLRLIENPAEAVSLGAAGRAKIQAGRTLESEAAMYISVFEQLNANR